MPRRPALALLAVPLLALTLAACGGSGDEAAPAATTGASPTTTSSAPAAPTTTVSASSAAPSSSAAAASAPDPGPAPAGAVIAAGAAATFPDSVGPWTRDVAASDAVGTIYDRGSDSNTAALLSAGSSYESMSTNVVQEVTPAGTGVCGLTSSGFSKVCYLAGADGVVSLTGDDDLSVAELATFANQLTAALGTS